MIKAWLYRTSLKKRIWVSFTILTVFCVALTGLCAYVIAARAMERNASQLNKNVISQSVNVLDQKLKQIIVASSTMMLSETFKQTIRDIQANNTERYFVNFSLLQGQFTQAELTENTIDSILISTPHGDFYSNSKLRKAGVPFESTSLYQRIKQDPASPWIEYHQDELFVGGNRVISLILQPLTENYVPDVFLTINVKEAMLEKVVSGGADHGSTRFLLIKKDGTSVIGDQNRPDWTRSASFVDKLGVEPEGEFEYNTDAGTMLVSYAQSSYARDWVLISYLSKEGLLQPVRNIQWMVLLIIAGCTLLTLLLAAYLSGLLLTPLQKLQRTMKRVGEEDLNARFESPFQDEIAEAGQRFNEMLDRINGLIVEVKATEKEKRKAEIKALQAQIDPHFLYNTLNTIFWKCEMDEYEDVKQMLISLSKLFRLGLNNGLELTTLDKELEHVRQYLSLQQQCYEGLFEYTITAPPELLNRPVLKIIIQPLVENSILHGLKEKREQGQIHIEVTIDETFLIIRVTDNGIGVDADQLNASLREAGGSGGYALSNIRNRIMLYYGQAAAIHFTSIPYEATVATLLIPLEGEDES